MKGYPHWQGHSLLKTPWSGGHRLPSLPPPVPLVQLTFTWLCKGKESLTTYGNRSWPCGLLPRPLLQGRQVKMVPPTEEP